MADVFISYSHCDHQFALQLVGALALRRYTTWLDQNDVLPAGEFREDIKAGIEEAGAFIFVLSPDSISSEECSKELSYAQECSKKLIPVYYRRITAAQAPQVLQKLSWIPLTPLTELSQEDTPFERMLGQVLVALQTDRHYWQKAGQWLRLAMRWDEALKRHSTEQPHVNLRTNHAGMKDLIIARCMSALHKAFENLDAIALRNPILLRGKELKEAEGWLKEAEHWRLEESNKKPQPLPLHNQFIRESRRTANRFLLTSIVAILLLIGITGGGAFLLLRSPDPRVVTNLADDGQGSLRWCIANAPDGSTIRFDTTPKRGTIVVTSADLRIEKNLNIVGLGATVLAIRSINNRVIYVDKDYTVTITGLAFMNTVENTTIYDSSFIHNLGTLTLANSVISGNTALNGGGVFNDVGGTLRITNSVISDNTATGIGGGISNEDGTLIIANSVISGNTALSGGGIDTHSSGMIANPPTGSTGSGIMATFSSGSTLASGNTTLSITNSIISDNTATGPGGGIDSFSSLTSITNSTISNNRASHGGGVLSTDGLTSITNSTISDNRATASDGGGIQSLLDSVVDISFCTIANNASVGNGGGIDIISYAAVSSQVKIRNSIVAVNRARTHPGIAMDGGRLTTYGYNLIQDFSHTIFDDPQIMHATDVSADQLPNVKIGDLRDNKGSTHTQALLSGSPAINKIPYDHCFITLTDPITGRNLSITSDQRGMKRPDGNEQLCDIGAYESQD